ncbi:P-loop NTPase fold protein [Acidovorax sp.]|uniref:KAP family P-loop NTPase fold protein n=1 Tax=Acidovorax sp. TaxID=1872122 RepID=UPI0025BD3846|nr:P-loop NTPase fold protein [Acidovorax sp.]
MGKKNSQSEHAIKHRTSDVDYDVPLKADSALKQDKLSRKGYAEIAAAALRKVPSSAGLVVSIEGAWGSGKTSVLAMIEALLLEDEELASPLIVHFNPWLVGDKDALLRHFLSRIASAVKLNDHSRYGKKVAREIKAYAKVFDLVKLIPGAEPWASMIKSVVEAAGEATGAVSEYKTPDIEAYKLRVEDALRNFDRPIIVFIDDIDRLFPLEVFEMVRIIKAVGGLPRLGYVVAWDSVYVGSALEKLGVPHAASYLDKIVQVRMPLPSLSLVARRKLIEDALDGLDPEALRHRFRNQDDRLGSLYHSGLRDLLEQPRDIARVFNAVRMMEPLLRDEIVFADILGLAALSVKAPAVFDLLRKKPFLFVGALPGDITILKPEDLIKEGAEERRIAFEASGVATAAKRVVHFLFPRVASADDSLSLGKGTYVEGNISHPAKLAIALQLSLTDGDVSIKAARQYLQNPARRESVVTGLTSENCDEFIDLLGEVGESLRGEGIADLDELCVSITRLVEKPLLVERAKKNRRGLRLRIEDMALRAVSLLAGAMDKERIAAISKLIATDSVALSCAAEVVTRSYVPGRDRYSDGIELHDEDKVTVLRTFSENVLKAAKTEALLKMNHVSFILWTMARVAPQECPALFSVLKESDPTLDLFALYYLGGTWDSTKGDSYSLPRDASLHEVYCPLADLKSHAITRLQDANLQYPERAAWRAVVDEKHLYGVDGTEARY